MENKLILGDNLDILKKWTSEGKKEFIDLNYNDPPFNSNRNYNILFNPKTDTVEEAFRDTWSSIKYFDLLEDFKENDVRFYEFLKKLEVLLPTDSLKSYIITMGITYWYIYKMLKPTASLYHHCDPTTSYYIKIVLDKIFGFNNFKNEIIWKRIYSTGGVKSGNTRFGNNHDVILWYVKSKVYTFNEPYQPWPEDHFKKALEKGQHFDDNDGKGQYFWSCLSFASEKKIKELTQKDEIRYKSTAKYPEYKCYIKNSKGIPIGDIWTDILPLTPKIIKYPTEKPEKLMERIILTGSNKNDVVADFFNGGGTTIITAIKLNRNFVGVDLNHRALQLTYKRLDKLKMIAKENYYIEGIPRSSKDLRELVNKNIYGKDKDSKYALEDITTKWYLEKVQGNIKKSGDGSIDGRFSFIHNKKPMKGIVQITSSASKNHFKAFCSEVSKGTGDIGVYITFEDTLTKGIIKEAKEYGRIGDVDKIQILTFEDLIDNREQYKLPKDILLI